MREILVKQLQLKVSKSANLDYEKSVWYKFKIYTKPELYIKISIIDPS